MGCCVMCGGCMCVWRGEGQKVIHVVAKNKVVVFLTRW